jgi:Recombinase.
MTERIQKRIAFGYKRNALSRIEVNLPQAMTVKLIFELYADGKSLQSISTKLGVCNIPSPYNNPKWGKQAIFYHMIDQSLNRMGEVKDCIKNYGMIIVDECHHVLVTRPVEDFHGKDITALQETLSILKTAGLCLVFKSNIHQKFAVMDQKIVWHGSINLMSFGNAEESIMRLESYNIANELIKSLH